MKLSTILGSVLALAAAVTAYPNPIAGSDTMRPRYMVQLCAQEILRVFDKRRDRNLHQYGVDWPMEEPPDINFIDGLYTLYYAVSTLGSQTSAIAVAKSPSMEPGTWTDLGQVISSAPGDLYNAIDPNIINDAMGLKLSFGSYWNGMYQIGLWPGVNNQASSLPGTHLAGGSGRPAEGGFVYKPASQPYFYFFFSDGVSPVPGATSRPAAGSEYKVLFGRGASATGPFYGELGNDLTLNLSPPMGSLVLASHDNVYAPGGQSVFADPVSGRDVIVYHYAKLSDPIGSPSYLGINYLDFSSGWPVVVA
ncbi:glycosyl hydrolase [Mycena epipterygia]|nr:glycosyl hydrolase [Mycena epipterygia]